MTDIRHARAVLMLMQFMVVWGAKWSLKKQ